jgi:predicted ribosome quality control (RQC) complex YloA/Tae2 family protein
MATASSRTSSYHNNLIPKTQAYFHGIITILVEGLFIAKQLEEIGVRLPARNLGWVFPNETTAALLLEDKARKVLNLVLEYKAPSPTLYTSTAKLEGDARNAFQRALENKVKGDLLSVQQLKLDRVVMLEFGLGTGFVGSDAARLLFELTGRNANLLILEAVGEGQFSGRIQIAAREITNSRNRFRTIRSGGLYTPPPPYEKLDPRVASDDELRTVLADKPISAWGKVIDGLGTTLLRELEHRLDKTGDVVLALRDLVANPSLSSEDSLSDQARDRTRLERLTELRKSIREPLEKRSKLLEKQFEDLHRAEENAVAALEWRESAETLLAYSRDVPSGADSVTLPSLYNEGTVSIALEPDLSAAQNANKLFAKAKRREDVLEKLLAREPERATLRTQITALLEEVQTASESRLRDLLEVHNPNPEAPPTVGMRYRTSSGLEVLVGRNSKENEVLTHRIAKSADIWFHVQGYPGSHVILRGQNKEIPFADILEAASIAAWFSKARGSTSVAVDYLFAKHVWRPKGARSGAVHFSHQKTVVVEPVLPS